MIQTCINHSLSLLKSYYHLPGKNFLLSQNQYLLKLSTLCGSCLIFTKVVKKLLNKYKIIITKLKLNKPQALEDWAEGAFNYAKNSRNFGRKSNGKVCFSSVWQEDWGQPSKVVHFNPSEQSDQNWPFYIFNWQISSLPYMYFCIRVIIFSWPGLIKRWGSILLG